MSHNGIYRAKFAGSQTGALPPVWVQRNTTAYDGDGTQIAADTARYATATARPNYGTWEQMWATGKNTKFAAVGQDWDGTDIYATYDTGTNTISVFYGGVDIDSSPDQSWQIRRGADSSTRIDSGTGWLVDVMTANGGTPLAEHAFNPKAGTVLSPGCLVFLCAAYTSAAGSSSTSSDAHWQQDGCGFVVIQRRSDGTWRAPQLLGYTTGYQLEEERGNSWCMVDTWSRTAYSEFPPAGGQEDSFLVAADYQNGTKQGGQVIMCSAEYQVTESFTQWQFGSVYKVYEETPNAGSGLHFHSAGWTPRGILLATGDNPSYNQNYLFKCTDWDDYTNPSNWTTVQVYGSGVDDITSTSSQQADWREFGFQFGAISRTTTGASNTVMVDADVHRYAFYKTTVESDDTISIIPQGHPTPTVTHKMTVCLGHNNNSPNFAQHVALARPQGLTAAQQRRSGRLWLAQDDDAYPITRLPASASAAAHPFFYNGDIHLDNNSSPGGDEGIYRLNNWGVRSATRPLAINPGSTNYLQLNAGALYNAAADSPNTAVLTADATAPGQGPVYVCTGNGGQDWLTFDVTSGGSVPNGDCWLLGWIKLPDGATRGVQVDWRFTGTSTSTVNDQYVGTETWMPFAIHHAGVGSANHTIDLRSQNNEHTEFRVQIEGYYQQDACPYLGEIDSTNADEQAEIRVLDPADPNAYTIGLELRVPHCGLDLTHPSATAYALATLRTRESDTYVELVCDTVNDTLDADIYVDGLLDTTLTVGTFHAFRNDSIWIQFTVDNGTATLAAVAGGFTDSGLQSSSGATTLDETIHAVRIGADNDYTVVSPVECYQVIQDTSAAREASGITSLITQVTENAAPVATPPTISNTPNDTWGNAATSATVATATNSVTVSVATECLICIAWSREGVQVQQPTGVTFSVGSTAFDAEVVFQEDTSTTDTACSVWRLNNPPLGTGTVTVTWAAAQARSACACYVIDGALQSDLIDVSTGSAHPGTAETDHSLTLNTLANVLCLYSAVCGDTSTAVAAPYTETVQINRNNMDSRLNFAASQPNAAGGNITMGHTLSPGSSHGADVMLAIKADPDFGGTTGAGLGKAKRSPYAPRRRP